MHKKDGKYYKYKATSGSLYNIGDDMSKDIYQHEDLVLRKRVKDMKHSQEEMYNDVYDDMSMKIYQTGIRIIRNDLNWLESIYYGDGNEQYGKWLGEEDE